MDGATTTGKPGRSEAFLAGLQAGLIGVLWMLAWLGMSAMLERRGFWMPENLFASAFYGNSAMHLGFAASTLSGLSLYVLLYSLLGAVFALAIHGRVPGSTLRLAAMAFALICYYLTFQMVWKSLIPLAAILHSRSATVVGHVLYGALLARFPAYLPRETELRQAPDPADPVSAGQAVGLPHEEH